MGLVVYALVRFDASFSVWGLLLSILLLLNGLILYTCLRLFSVLPVFWTHDRFGFNMLFEAMSRLCERPEVIFRGITHLILVTVLPFLVITSYPARAIFSDISAGAVVQSLAASVMLSLSVYVVWKRGLRVYSSASS